jgi:hypothetical protein
MDREATQQGKSRDPLVAMKGKLTAYSTILATPTVTGSSNNISERILTSSGRDFVDYITQALNSHTSLHRSGNSSYFGGTTPASSESSSSDSSSNIGGSTLASSESSSDGGPIPSSSGSSKTITPVRYRSLSTTSETSRADSGDTFFHDIARALRSLSII